MRKIFFAIALLGCGWFSNFNVSAQTVPLGKILFDNTKGETASNADWQIDADAFNLTGNEANPQRFPTPLQNTVVSTTAETYWQGALSSWGITMVKLGYRVETLPHGNTITYGTNAVQDLKNYDVFIIDEPNNPLSTAEKAALIAFVNAGGGLFMVSDHNISDRDNDGWDSPKIWNDLLLLDPFGFKVDLVNISGSYYNPISNSLSDSVLNGPAGLVTGIKYNNGTTLTSTGTNPTVKPLIFTSGSSNTGTTNICALSARHGNGKIMMVGDSSPTDDGTGDPNDNLFAGWTDLNGNHAKLLTNATIWLAAHGNTTTGVSSTVTAPTIGLNTWVSDGVLHAMVSNLANTNTTNTGLLVVQDAVGKTVFTTTVTDGLFVQHLPTSGAYFIKVVAGNGAVVTKRVIR